MKTNLIQVEPISKKAKNRLINLMDNDPNVDVEQDLGDRIFCASSNRKYFFWVTKSNSTDWRVVE
jgi:hypothetical protein